MTPIEDSAGDNHSRNRPNGVSTRTIDEGATDVEMPEDSLHTLSDGLGDLGLRISPEASRQFATLLNLLVASNSQLNLSGVRDPDGIVHRHFIESVAIGAQLERRGLFTPGACVVDLGSGAGFPGLPLKLVWPELDMSLLEATGKKARFIQDAVVALGLERARVLLGRAETLGHLPELREHFALVITRTVAPLPALVELSLPFLRVGGSLAAAKGSRAQEEIVTAAAALDLCGGELSEHIEAIEGASLGLVIIRKTSPTPAQYARRPGQPSSHPLSARG
jgi:16S rRNA (guanine527-N7)-methyltransferase